MSNAISPMAASHSMRSAVGRNPTRKATATTSAKPSIVWITDDDVPGENRNPSDGHGAEAGDDPFGHVHRHRDRR